MKRFLCRAFCMGVIAIAIGITIRAQAPEMKDESRIRELAKAWSDTAGTKALDKTVSFYAEDASMLPVNAPIATGRAAIRQVWQKMMALPGYELTFGPTKVDVAKAGDMAYEIGTYHLKANDIATVGKYVVAWKKQKNGEWKVAADIFNTDK